MKKVYIAARAKYRADEVAAITQHLKDMGYEPAYDWPKFNHLIKKPYRLPQNRITNEKAQAMMLKAAATTDIFIFLDDPGLRGAYIELGVFLYSCLTNSKNRKAFIVGPDSHKREFIFESPDYVVFADAIDQVYKDLTNP